MKKFVVNFDYTEEREELKMIYLKKHSEILTENGWVSDPRDEPIEEYIDVQTYQNIVCKEAQDFFIALGGTEKLTRKSGLVTKLISTSPDNKQRYIYAFTHE